LSGLAALNANLFIRSNKFLSESLGIVLPVTSFRRARIQALAATRREWMSTMIIGSTTVRPAYSSRIASHLKKMKETIAEWQNRLHSRRELAAIDDAGLRDIGVSRSTARYEISKPFWTD
jgi:uncharacterized protein YjiS (DUF1127 family)